MSKVVDLVEKIFRQIEVKEVGGRRVVVKRYDAEVGFIKWLMVKTASYVVPVYPFALSPRERLRREATFFEVRPGGVNTPRIIEVDYSRLKMVREYIEGVVFKPESPRDAWYDIGRTLCRVHKGEYTMGDSKFTNFMVSDKGIYIIDAEQAIETDKKSYKAWDILIFLVTTYYPLMTRLVDPSKHEGLRNFILGYADEGGSDVLNTLSGDMRFKTLSNILLPPPHGYKLLRTIKGIIRA